MRSDEKGKETFGFIGR